jgi:hypothetical protein
MTCSHTARWLWRRQLRRRQRPALVRRRQRLQRSHRQLWYVRCRVCVCNALTRLTAERGFATREELPLPSKPPYTAHLGNLSFDATEGDVTDFFADCEVTNVRIVEDKLDRKPKGFGYVEFGTVDGLKKALDLSGTQFQGRNVRVSVAEPRMYSPHRRRYSV